MSFMSELKSRLEADYNVSVTENGAFGYRTTTDALLDYHFQLSSFRSASDDEIARRFRLPLAVDPNLAIKWLFYARDVRGGLGERRLFRVILEDLARNYPSLAKRILDLVPYYGRYDDLWGLLDTDLAPDVAKLVKKTLLQDEKLMSQDKAISLIAKWLPSTNAGIKSRSKALKLIKLMGLSENFYRRKLSKLRKYLEIVESKMCAQQWSEIDYSKVPSKASLNYQSAFERHDSARYSAYIERVNSNKDHINSSTLYPHEIVSKYLVTDDSVRSTVDNTLEVMWKSLPDTYLGNNTMLVVRDGSYSMTDRVGSGRATCLAVATALTLYFAERLPGEFKDKFLTFSSEAKFVDVSGASDLRTKLAICYGEDDCSNTDIQNVFQVILDTAVANRLTQSDLPKNILIFSDMEFDGDRFHWNSNLFDSIKAEYHSAGYELPKLIFWNLGSRTETIPMIKNELGLVLTSGFSQNSAKMIMSGELDPMKALLEVINSERYAEVDKALDN